MNDEIQSPISDLEADLMDVLYKYIERRASVSEQEAVGILLRIAARLENDQREWDYDFDPNC